MNELFIPAKTQPYRTEEIPRSTRPFTGGPKPEALIIACSDCTLDETLSRHFQDEPVFLLRTFGNEVPEFIDARDELIEALEEAVSWWRVPRIIVCGHSGCRAMVESPYKRPPSSAPSFGTLTDSQSLFDRVAQANQILARAKSHTVEQLAALRTYPFIENGVAEHDLQFSAMFYLHESGLFLRYDEAEGKYDPLM
jgi:carbonic anhydrase